MLRQQRPGRRPPTTRFHAKRRHFANEAAAFTREHGRLAREVLCLETAALFGDATVSGRLDELAHRVDGPRARLAARYARALDLDDAAELDRCQPISNRSEICLPRPTLPGNRAIAHAVSLSVRTIEGHIYRVSCKVGVASRSDLGDVVRDLTDRDCAAAPTPARG